MSGQPADLPAAHRGHAVKFYEDNQGIVDSIFAFVGEGLRSDGVVAVVATREHIDLLESRLIRSGFQLPRAKLECRFLVYEAEQVRARLMPDGHTVDRGCFNGFLQEVMERSWGGAPRPLRIFGEMVNILWGQRQREAALQLEQLWNEAVRDLGFALLCGYCLDGFASAEDASAFDAVCEHHGQVQPVRGPPRERWDQTLRDFAELEQKARALATEHRHRMALEELLQQEIRTPLTALRLYLQWAERLIHGGGGPGTSAWPIGKALAILSRSTERLDRLRTGTKR